jgi:predicted Zn-dependent protease
MYLNYTREGEAFPIIEEYAIPLFENRSVYALEKVLESANIQNQDYLVLNTPAPAQWPSTASLGELIPLTVSVKDYLDILTEVKKQVQEFANSL